MNTWKRLTMERVRAVQIEATWILLSLLTLEEEPETEASGNSKRVAGCTQKSRANKQTTRVVIIICCYFKIERWGSSFVELCKQSVYLEWFLFQKNLITFCHETSQKWFDCAASSIKLCLVVAIIRKQSLSFKRRSYFCFIWRFFFDLDCIKQMELCKSLGLRVYWC